MEAPDIAVEILQTPSIASPIASPSGDHVAFLQDGTGRYELYVVNAKTGTGTQISDGEVPRDPWGTPLLWGPSEDCLFFHTVDDHTETSEFYSIFLQGNVTRLITVEARCMMWDISPNEDRIWFFRRDSDGYTLCHYNRRQQSIVEVPYYPAHVSREGGCSPNGENIAYTTIAERDDHRTAYIAAADGSDPEPLDVGDEKTGVTVHGWHPDGQQLLLTKSTFEDSEPDYCGRYDTKTDDVTWVEMAENAGLRKRFLPTGDRFLAVHESDGSVVERKPAVYDFAGNVTELSVTCNRRYATRPTMNVSLSEERILVSHNSETLPYELLAYDTASDEYTSLVKPKFEGVDPETFVSGDIVSYETADGTKLPGLLYDSGERPSPAIVWMYGGVPSVEPEFRAELQLLVNQGYTVFRPTNRGKRFTDSETADFAAAGRWLASQEWIDSDSVAIYGHSHGGYDVYMQMVMHPELWAGGIAWNGMTDLRMLRSEQSEGKADVAYPFAHLVNPDENPDQWRQQSPITHVDSFSGPLLMLHGEADPAIPVSHAREFRHALEVQGFDEGVDFEYEELEQTGHSSHDMDQQTHVWSIIFDFLFRRIKNGGVSRC